MGKWRRLETLRRGRWWFFWNFVVRGRALRFSVWADTPSKLRIDDLDATIKISK